MSTEYKKVDQIGDFWVCPGDFLAFGAKVVPDGVNFTVNSVHAVGVELMLFHNEENEPYAKLRFPDAYRIGNTYAMVVFGLNIKEFEYAYRIIELDEKGNEVYTPQLLDIYARAVTGQRVWGEKPDKEIKYKARVVEEDFDWGNFKQPEIPFNDLIIYEMHVRGFTMDKSSKVKKPGTFAGIKEKIPYLKELGINAVELMPIFEFDELEAERFVDGKQVLNYWGYNTVSFFAPNTSYASKEEHNHEGDEFKDLVKTLNENGIEVILDVVFNHTSEGDDRGPTYSFKGFDKDVYYMLTPDGHFFNFSGCGNTMNCNHPIVRQMIINCLKYWVSEYRVDGFRFDLATILGRAADGSPLSSPPLLEALAFEPVLGKTKLIAEAWDAGGLYQVGTFPAWKRWAEWNGRYRDDIRRFLKSDAGMADAAIRRITGSLDIYDPNLRGRSASVNFITCHDGFTLHDLYAYNEKHNEANGWNNTDGTNDNYSWNCGIEGDTQDPEIKKFRNRMRENAVFTLMVSRGIPMLLAGDEFGNSQYGNNNAYCQDNNVSWLDWDRLGTHKHQFNFIKKCIDYRNNHPSVRCQIKPAACGLPDVSIHNGTPWNNYTDNETRTIGIMFAGWDEKRKRDDIVLILMNMHWDMRRFEMPLLPNGLKWKLEMSTGDESIYDGYLTADLMGRSIMAFTGK